MDVTQRRISIIARGVGRFTTRTMRREGIGASEFDLIQAVRCHPGITQAEVCQRLEIDKGAAARRAAFLLGGTVRGTVDAPIARSTRDRKKMAIAADGRSARTHYRVDEEFPQCSLLTLNLETGRTHQIRVHMAYLGHPVLGDPVYGGDGAAFVKKHPSLFDGQMLHAQSLTLTHPRTGEKMTFHAPLPDNFERALSILRKMQQPIG